MNRRIVNRNWGVNGWLQCGKPIDITLDRDMVQLNRRQVRRPSVTRSAIRLEPVRHAVGLSFLACRRWLAVACLSIGAAMLRIGEGIDVRD